MDKERVLFLCTGNSARSQMAEALLKKYAADRYEAHSAGLDPQGINPYAAKVMEEVGISLEGQRSKSLKEYLGNMNFSFFITVCAHAEAHCPTAFLMSAGRHLHWNFEDPAAAQGTDEEKLARFREIRDRIDARIRELLTEQGAGASA